MKKLFVSALITFSVISLTGCGNDELPEQGEPIEEVEVEEDNGQVEELEVEREGEIFDREIIDD